MLQLTLDNLFIFAILNYIFYEEIKMNRKVLAIISTMVGVIFVCLGLSEMFAKQAAQEEAAAIEEKVFNQNQQTTEETSGLENIK